MAMKIMSVGPVKNRLGQRDNPRGKRLPNKTWNKAAHRLKIANAAQKIWKCPEIRHAAYEKLLGKIDGNMSEVSG